MGLVIRFALLVLFVVSSAALHLGISFLLPYPFNKINIIFVIVLFFILRGSSGAIVWFSFLLHYLIELYATSPFGVILFSGTMSTLAIYTLSHSMFSSAKPTVALGLATTGMLVYRTIYSGALFLAHFILDIPLNLGPQLIKLYAWELFLTTILVFLVYSASIYFGGTKPTAHPHI